MCTPPVHKKELSAYHNVRFANSSFSSNFLFIFYKQLNDTYLCIVYIDSYPCVLPLRL